MLIQEIRELVIKGGTRKIQEHVEKAIEQGLDVSSILNDGLVAGMQYIGEKFKVNEVYVPEVLMAARTMQKGVDVLRPLIIKAGIKEKATIIIGAVKGDLHDIGTNMVTMMLEGNGYKVINLGVDISAEQFAEAIEKYNPKIVGLAALLTSTLPEMKNTVEYLKLHRDKVKIMVGGAPVTQKFADEISADSYAADAGSAVSQADSLLTGSFL
jgi:5-methyltetrahydrofolate--homocysteine methyltransferase